MTYEKEMLSISVKFLFNYSSLSSVYICRYHLGDGPNIEKNLKFKKR